MSGRRGGWGGEEGQHVREVTLNQGILETSIGFILQPQAYVIGEPCPFCWKQVNDSFGDRKPIPLQVLEEGWLLSDRQKSFCSPAWAHF